jgi:hypothetical protein
MKKPFSPVFKKEMVKLRFADDADGKKNSVEV